MTDLQKSFDRLSRSVDKLRRDVYILIGISVVWLAVFVVNAWFGA